MGGGAGAGGGVGGGGGLTVAEAVSGGAAGAGTAEASEWQIDFCSRPLLDDRKKKVWELNVCDSQGGIRFQRYFANNQVNSGELRRALEDLCASEGLVFPARALFFRMQMQTIISRALGDLGMQAVPSRRCVELMEWLDERGREVYPADPRYSPGTGPALLEIDPLAQELPDAMMGEEWEFVELPLTEVEGEVARVLRGECFGQVFEDMGRATGTAAPAPSTPIPGIVVISARASAIAARLSALEVDELSCNTRLGCLVLRHSANLAYRHGYFEREGLSLEEARAWQAAREGVSGLHFLALMSDNDDEEECAGFWLMRSRPLPEV